MKAYAWSLVSLGFAVLSLVRADDSSNITETIMQNADADSIDLSVLPDLSSILGNITATYEAANVTIPSRRSFAARHLNLRDAGPLDFTRIADVHAHCVADWYRALVPTTGGNPTPSWNISGHLAFMASESITRSVLAFSAPGANVYKGSEGLTIALARLINEQTAAYVRAYPKQFAFYAVVPLPYTDAAIAEANYALDTLGAAGIALYSNFEGRYLGDAGFKPFFQALNKRGAGQIVYVHPTDPVMKVNGQFVVANPTVYPTGNIEFYFETARMIEDIAVTQTIHNFTNINYIIPHVGGAFPSIADRLLKSFPAIYDSSMKIFQTRFFWDSAGPTYIHQVAGLLAYGIPASQLLFGTDFPYAPSFVQPGALAAIKSSIYVTNPEKQALFTTNAQNLFGKRLPSG